MLIGETDIIRHCPILLYGSDWQGKNQDHRIRICDKKWIKLKTAPYKLHKVTECVELAPSRAL